jgi:hypothetical protein
MRAEPEEHVILESKRSVFPLVELLLATAVLAGLVFLWFWLEEKEPVATVVEVPAIADPAPKPDLPRTPDIPQRPEPVAGVDAETADSNTPPVEQPEPEPPMTPADGDALLRQQLAAANADVNLGKLMNNEHPLDVSAALIDGLGRGIILRKMLPADPPKQAFSVAQDGDALYMSTASYERYDGYTDAIASLDSGILVDTFHTLRPLYEQAFEQLGLDGGDFDNAVIRTLDMVLATPEIDEPITLKPKSVVYIYTDPALESLPAVQKQLLRMGPDNIRRLKQQARILRDGLLAQ